MSEIEHMVEKMRDFRRVTYLRSVSNASYNHRNHDFTHLYHSSFPIYLSFHHHLSVLDLLLHVLLQP